MYKEEFPSACSLSLVSIGVINWREISDVAENILLKKFEVNVVILIIFFFLGSLLTFFLTKTFYNKIIAENKKREHEATLNEVIAGIADGIRNPLVSVKGFIQLEQMKKNSTLKNNIELLLVEIRQIENLINNFLKLSTNNFVPNFVIFDIGAQLKEIHNLMASEADGLGIKLLFNIPSDEIFIKGDPKLIKEMVMLLISNSLEAIQKDGVINVELICREKFIKITISDNGPGISPDIFPRIGRPFNTSKGTAHPGLGLAICKRIIEIHQGYWKIKTGEKIGTTITITLPKKDFVPNEGGNRGDTFSKY